MQADPFLKELWGTACGKEFGNMAQGDKCTNTSGTNSNFIMIQDEIDRIPEDCTITTQRL